MFTGVVVARVRVDHARPLRCRMVGDEGIVMRVFVEVVLVTAAIVWMVLSLIRVLQ